jgi:hypothetical protein
MPSFWSVTALSESSSRPGVVGRAMPVLAAGAVRAWRARVRRLVARPWRGPIRAWRTDRRGERRPRPDAVRRMRRWCAARAQRRVATTRAGPSGISRAWPGARVPMAGWGATAPRR